MRNKNLKALFNLVNELIFAAFEDDHVEQERLLQKQNELITQLTPLEYYKYMATLAAANEDKTFKQFDAEIIAACKSSNLAVKSKYLAQKISLSPDPDEIAAISIHHPAPPTLQ